jgi:hypothetical protein
MYGRTAREARPSEIARLGLEQSTWLELVRTDLDGVKTKFKVVA